MCVSRATGKSEYLKVPDFEVQAGTSYHLAISFGEDGLNLYLNGRLAASEPDFKQGMAANERALVVGASGAWRSDDSHTAGAQFDGTISDVMVFGAQLDKVEMASFGGCGRRAF